jgi:mannose-6-phosphate isomerase-like protein (cupin superfamily)
MRALTSTTLTILVLACGWGRAAAQSPETAGAKLWTAGDLRLLDKTLIPEMSGTGAAYTYVLRGKAYGMLLLHREETGDPELHVKVNDFFVVLGGEAEIRVGGRVAGQKTVGPGEKRGHNLVGGMLYRVAPGDILFVPANHWLQVVIAKGKVLRAMVIKAQ